MLLAFFIILFSILLIRIGYLQFIKGSWLRSKAYSQQTTSQVLNSKRGTIYDSTNKILAISSLVDTVSVNKGEVQYSDGKEVPNEVLASGFSEVFSLDYEETLNIKQNAVQSLVNKTLNNKIKVTLDID